MSRLLCALIVGAALVMGAPSQARADEGISVGAELVALSDVTLSKAEIVKGARVSVAKLMQHDVALVELADGHMVKVAIGTLRSLFRVDHQ